MDGALVENQYGFAWGPALVRRVARVRGYCYLTVATSTGQELEIRISPTGQSLKVFRDGRELT